MAERGIAPIVILGVAAAVVFGAGLLYQQTRAPGAQESVEDLGHRSLQQEIADIKQQLESALHAGGIHANTKAEIVMRIEAMRARGASDADVGMLREILSRISGEQSGAPQLESTQKDPEPAAASPRTVAQPAYEPAGTHGPQSCARNPSPLFTHHVTDMSKVDHIKPPPNIAELSGDLKTHSYLETGGRRVPVYAPVDMTLIGGAHYEGGPFMLDFRVSCEVKVRFAHITEPIDEIRALFPTTPAPRDDSRAQTISHEIEFKAGDLIAYTVGTNPGAGNWDFGVYNSAKPNKYASDPARRASDIWTTAVCPFGYFTEELKVVYRAKLDFSGYGGLKPDGESFCSGL